MDAIGKLFGAGKAQGPTDAEKAAQRDQQNEAKRADAEADQKLALGTRAAGLRRALTYSGPDKKGSLGA